MVIGKNNPAEYDIRHHYVKYWIFSNVVKKIVLNHQYINMGKKLKYFQINYVFTNYHVYL